MFKKNKNYLRTATSKALTKNADNWQNNYTILICEAQIDFVKVVETPIQFQCFNEYFS